MIKFRAFLWTSILGGALLLAPGSTLANSAHARHGVSYPKHRSQLVLMYRDHRGETINAMRPARYRFGAKGSHVRRHGSYTWVKHHPKFHHRYWKHYHRRGAWVRGPIRRGPHTVIIEREVEVEREIPSIQIGPEELSVVIPLPW